MINVGQIIGTGIFSNPSYILTHCGSGGMMLILWLVGATFAATGVWSYIELGTMLPRSGGEQEYLANQYPNPKELISFVFLIVVGILGRGSGLANGANAFGSNMIYAIGGSGYVNHWGARGFAVFCLTFWLVLNIVSAKTAIRANNVFTLLKVALLVLLICVGFAGLAGRFPNQPDLSINFSFNETTDNAGSYASAIYYVVYAYGGWYNLNYILDELKDPIKNLPRCAVSALTLTTILYILANIAYLSVLPLAVIKSSELTVAANLFNASLGGVFGGRVLPVLVGMSSFGFVGVIFYSGSRVVLEASRKGYLPYDRFFSRLHPGLQTPIHSLVLLYIISLIFLLAPPPGTVFQFIVAFAGYGGYFFSALSVIGIFILRKTQPDINRPYKVPTVVALVFIVICFYTLVFVFVPPVSPPSGYPYWLPYTLMIIVGLLSVVLWYYKIQYKDALSTSYNAEISVDGKQELFDEIYEGYGSFKTDHDNKTVKKVDLNKPTIMPIENITTKVHWTSNKTIDQTLIKTKQAKYDATSFESNTSFQFKQRVKKVAIIGAGPAGLPTAKHLLDEGLQVKIFERNAASGGTWIFNEDKPINPEFPAEIPTKVVKPSLPPSNAQLPVKQIKRIDEKGVKEELLRLTPPTPCYRSLRNNVPTPLLKYKDFDWRKDTPWFTTHEKILEYLQDYSSHFKLDDITEYNTSVEKLTELPNQSGWNVLTKSATVLHRDNSVQIEWKEEHFDAVVVATGHYHAQYVPNFSGLAEWRTQWPKNVIHSKEYRDPDMFKDKNVLLIGNGTSALDIARDIHKHAKTIYNSVRESTHQFDEKYLKLREELAKFLPKKVQRVAHVKEFKEHQTKKDIQDAVVELVDGTKITDLDYVIICTGYLFSFHFLEDLHDDEEVSPKRKFNVDQERVLVKDGSQVFNLHKDIFYIPNPTLSFVGIPFHIATFSLFEFQSYAVARVYSGAAKLPEEKAMRAEWYERAHRKGLGREFHALGSELELTYIKDIVQWLNEDGKALKKPTITEHDEEWINIRSNSLAALKKSLNITD
ncbi:hypothetical protein G6F58_003001 [Rhizopus delemar]|nr:hypothetical protein G6F58_003001 [Rhizopus delemar]